MPGVITLTIKVITLTIKVITLTIKVITLTIKVITLTVKVITPFLPVSYLFHKLKSGHPNLYFFSVFPGAISSRRAQKIDSTPKPSVQPLARRGAARRIAAQVNHTTV